MGPGCDHCYALTFAERFRGIARHSYEAEPLTGPPPGLDLTGIRWLIAGGESGPKLVRVSPPGALRPSPVLGRVVRVSQDHQGRGVRALRGTRVPAPVTFGRLRGGRILPV